MFIKIAISNENSNNKLNFLSLQLYDVTDIYDITICNIIHSVALYLGTNLKYFIYRPP